MVLQNYQKLLLMIHYFYCCTLGRLEISAYDQFQYIMGRLGWLIFLGLLWGSRIASWEHQSIWRNKRLYPWFYRNLPPKHQYRILWRGLTFLGLLWGSRIASWEHRSIWRRWPWCRLALPPCFAGAPPTGSWTRSHHPSKMFAAPLLTRKREKIN